MNKTLIPLIGLLTLPLSNVFSQSALPPQISVSGSAEVKVAPDEILLSVGVETRSETVEATKRENDERIAKALAFIKSRGVKDKDVQTDFISIEPTYDSNVSRTKPVIYTARKSIEIRLTRIESFEGFLTGLLTNGVTYVHGIDFRTTQLRKHRDTARAMAIRAAKEKADALTAELGVKRGKVYNISAQDWGGWSSGGFWGNYWGGRGGNMSQNAVQSSSGPTELSDPTLSIGQISVSASVSVTFLIQ